ncbi:MAG: HigA family addiction module antidote protein [Microcystis sp. M54BS1]|jgi:addiction module HigA family antidote|uniref:Plasmid maintenance system antidote protein n=23 Tax=Microcystis TaxID=1125 RepID=I4HRY3_MICAE|nr:MULTISPECIES: HigA family addiction module antitoxin [Microcystis]MBE5228468.1 HigA family addiction module antidote protein [Microcystis aeruginosa PMC 728.11]MCA2541763.1 HigA family addiction module antidote protein [Microcystis sp. M54BS1]MCA2597691.1 HigA family addiction module antidote protein [Microcystis sp. M38BS1]MCA2611208.1 HigA family addiction module antidote protein [Microcystis sp. M27BS1]MCA2817751.1 HigA family addiction module antidote protein [Microcystis sp. M085S1]MC
MTEKKLLAPIHPGEILLEEFLKPMEISQERLAEDLNVPIEQIKEIIEEKRGITADIALRLSRYFGMSERFWMNLQTRYDIEVEKDRLRERLEKEVKVYAASQAL